MNIYGFKYKYFQQVQHASNSATLPLAKSSKAHGHHRPTCPAVMVVSRWCHGVLQLQVSEDALLGKDSKEVFLKSADPTTEPFLLQGGKQSVGSSVSSLVPRS